MQGLEFSRALREIAKELKVEELTALIYPWVKIPTVNINITDSAKDEFAKLLFESSAGYQLLMRQSSTRQILEKLDIKQFYEPLRLRTMIAAVTGAPQTGHLAGNIAAMAQFASFTELLSSFKRLAGATRELLEDQKIGLHETDVAIVELELVEYSDEQGFSPKRLEVLASSIAELHMHLAILNGVQADRLIFKYLDSGSGLLFGMKCAKVIAESMNTLFIQWWDRIVFFRYDTFDKKMAAATKSLALVEAVHQSIEKGAITPEEGENLKYRVFQEMDSLTGIGVTVPITDAATVDRRQMLTEIRNVKLLSDGNETEAIKAEDPEVQ